MIPLTHKVSMVGKQSRKGTAILDVAVVSLYSTIKILPAQVIVVGSEFNDRIGFVRLILESEHFSGHDNIAALSVTESGLSKTISIKVA